MKPRLFVSAGARGAGAILWFTLTLALIVIALDLFLWRAG